MSTVVQQEVRRTFRLESVAELRARQPEWDDLWLRSRVTIPTVQAEPLAQWIESFSAGAQFQALIVQQDNRWIAALPLVVQPFAKLVPVARLPVNEWTPAGELLVDESFGPDAVAPLVAQLTRIGCPLIHLAPVFPQATRWQWLLDQFRRMGATVSPGPESNIAFLATTDDWNAVQAAWSKGTRKRIRRAVRGLEETGELSLRIVRPDNSTEVEQACREAFGIEQRGWKARSGTAILSQPDVARWYLRQARTLARQEQLEIAFLDHAGKPIAFEYAWSAKSIWHSVKVGFDEAYAAHDPGHVLLFKLLAVFHADPDRDGIHLMSPITPALARWRPQASPMSSATIPTNGIGRMLIGLRKIVHGVHN